MVRDWWWPWWISTTFDLALAVVALVGLVRATHRAVRIASALLLCSALVAAVLAPVVMTQRDDRMQPTNMMTP